MNRCIPGDKLLNIKISSRYPIHNTRILSSASAARKSGSSIPVLLIYKNLFNINSIINERYISIKLVQLTERVIELRHTGLGVDTGDDFENPGFRTDVLQIFINILLRPSCDQQSLRPQHVQTMCDCRASVKQTLPSLRCLLLGRRG